MKGFRFDSGRGYKRKKEKGMTKKIDLKHDPIREYIVKAISLTKEYQNRIFQIGIGILVILFVVYILNVQAEQKQLNATTSFGIALNSYIEAGSDSLAKSLTLSKFQEVIDDFENTEAGVYSKVYLAKEYFDNTDYDEATSLCNDIISSTDDDVLKSLIINMLGNIASNMGDIDEAIEYFLKASRTVKVEALSDNFKVNAVRAYISNKQFDNAINIAEAMLERENLKYTIKNEIEMLLTEAEFHSFN